VEAQHLLIAGTSGSGKTVALSSLTHQAAKSGWTVYSFDAHGFGNLAQDFEGFYRVVLQEVEARPEARFLVALDGGEIFLQATGGLHPGNSILASLHDEDLPNFSLAISMQTLGLWEEDAFTARAMIGASMLEREEGLGRFLVPEAAAEAYAAFPAERKRFAGVLEVRSEGEADYQAFACSL